MEKPPCRDYLFDRFKQVFLASHKGPPFKIVHTLCCCYKLRGTLFKGEKKNSLKNRLQFYFTSAESKKLIQEIKKNRIQRVTEQGHTIS